MSESIIIGVDHGYANMKTKNFVFPSGLVTYEHEPYSMERVLEYGGKYYVIGSGRQPLQKDKTASDNYYLLTLAAIAMELEYREAPPNSEIILAAGLPLTSFAGTRKHFAAIFCGTVSPSASALRKSHTVSPSRMCSCSPRAMRRC